MGGSSLSLIVIPIVVMAVLAAWLIIVYYADSHPFWRDRPAHPHAHLHAHSPARTLARPPADTQPAAPQRRAA
jgi:hypothetical protein